MARSRVLVNNVASDWEIPQFGGVVVPASGTLDITGLLADADILFAIEVDGLVLSATRFIRINVPGGTFDVTSNNDMYSVLDPYLHVALDGAYVEDDTESTAASDTPQPKLSLTFTPDSPGDFILSLSAEAGHSSTTGTRIRVTNVTDGVVLSENVVSTQYGTEYFSVFMRCKVTFSAVTEKTFTVYFWRRSAGTAKIRRVRIDIKRMYYQ